MSKFKFPWSLFWIFGFGILSAGCQGRPDIQYYKESRVMMGTYVEVICPQKEAAALAFDEIKRIEGLLSKYDPESEISRLNKTGEVKASAETFTVIKKAKEFWETSDGAFDITVAPLTDLWGFTNKEYSLPDPQDITRALGLVGSDKIALNESDNMIKFLVPGMKVDLGGLAKGFAVDCAINKLKEAGVTSALVNAGGQVYCLGKKSGKPWKVAVKDPGQEGVLNYLECEDRAVATSGDYEQYFTKANKRYGHIIDPKTGYPVETGLASVTVIASDGLTADLLSTALFVMGKVKGEALAGKFPDVKTEFVER